MIVDRGFRLESGVKIADDMIGVDSGYNIDAVCQWVRRRHNALALKGEDGWSRPAIFGAKAAEVKHSGPNRGPRQALRRQDLAGWHVRPEGSDDGLSWTDIPRDKSGFPNGYCHWPADTPDEYFKRMSSEYVKKNDDWRACLGQKGPNQWLDCRVYNNALTHHAGLWAWSEERWAKESGGACRVGGIATDNAGPVRSAGSEHGRSGYRDRRCR